MSGPELVKLLWEVTSSKSMALAANPTDSRECRISSCITPLWNKGSEILLCCWQLLIPRFFKKKADHNALKQWPHHRKGKEKRIKENFMFNIAYNCIKQLSVYSPLSSIICSIQVKIFFQIKMRHWYRNTTSCNTNSNSHMKQISPHHLCASSLSCCTNS